MANKTTVEKITKKLDDAETAVIKLIDISQITADGELEDVLKFNQEYVAVSKTMTEIANELIKFDKNRTHSLWDKFDSINDDLNYIYDTSSIPINHVLVNKTLELQDSYRRLQGLQLAVFSIVLTILAFVLTNAKILAASEIDFKNVLLVNLSFLLSADILFSCIYLFLGPIFYSKKGKLRTFTFIILPIILIVAIILVAIFMK